MPAAAVSAVRKQIAGRSPDPVYLLGKGVVSGGGAERPVGGTGSEYRLERGLKVGHLGAGRIELAHHRQAAIAEP